MEMISRVEWRRWGWPCASKWCVKVKLACGLDKARIIDVSISIQPLPISIKALSLNQL